ncbi:MAG: DMT family transporter [Candidatus Aminicenantales bacterium]
MSKRHGLAEIHLATILFSLAGLFGKWLKLPPSLIVLGRVFFASLALGFLIFILRQNLKNIPIKTYLGLAGLGAVLAIHWLAFFQSIQVSTVAIGLLAYSSFPIFTVMLEPLLFRERLDARNLILACFCLLGVFLIIPRFNPADSTFQGVLWGLGSGLTFAVLTIFNRKLTQTYSSLAIAFFEDLAATFFLWPCLFVTSGNWSTREVVLILFLGVVCTAGSHTLFIHGMRRVRAQTASLISSLEPVYGTALAFLFLSEVPSTRTLGGGLLIVAAVVMISIREASTRAGSSLLASSRPFS